MRLWPFYALSFTTSLSAPEALTRLHAEIGPPTVQLIVGTFNSSVGANTDRRMFLGQRLPDGGEFRNNLNNEPGELRSYNAFQAQVRVRIAQTTNGSAVSVSLRIATFVIIFCLVWSVPFVWATQAIASGVLRGEHLSPWLVLMGPGFISLVWLVGCFAFSADADRAERMLRATLERD
jgi:hypothetical protein